MARRGLILATADTAQALEDWIIDNKCNPKTEEEWKRCWDDLVKAGKAKYVGGIEDEDLPEFKKKLGENFNVKEE